MVGHMTLNHGILVRAQASQQANEGERSAKGQKAVVQKFAKVSAVPVVVTKGTMI